MRELARQRLDLAGIRSLCWDGGDLVDLPAGGTRLLPDGSITPARVHLAFAFDRAMSSVWRAKTGRSGVRLSA